MAMAARQACDLIYVASHGWKGDCGQWPGSVTLEILRHSQVPVLVHESVPQTGAGGRGRMEDDDGVERIMYEVMQTRQYRAGTP